MAQYCTGQLYVPSEEVVEDDNEWEECQHKNNPDYQKEVNNMLATILETKRQMDTTGQLESMNIQFEIQEFIMYEQKYPSLVKRLKKKFRKFNLTTSQFLKFIKIEQKFMNVNQQISSKKYVLQENDKETKTQSPIKSKKNLVEVHGILLRKRSYKLNPRIYQ